MPTTTPRVVVSLPATGTDAARIMILGVFVLGFGATLMGLARRRTVRS